MKSRLFHTQAYLSVQDKVRDLLNGTQDFLSKHTIESPRAVGDAIQQVIAESFGNILGEHCGEYSPQFARRAMADLAFKDYDGLYYIVDVKTHRCDTKFNMPNLTSVERLARFEFPGWDCLTIGALGWGQIQIANTKHLTLNPGYSRRRWMLEFCDTVLQFYPKEIAKIGERISHFERIRDFWSDKAED
jgi:hypothetical protein